MSGIPARSASLPPRRRLRLRAPHLCFDVRAEAIYWASARAGRRGLAPSAWGRIPRDPERSVGEQIAQLAASGVGREHECETGVSSSGGAHERATLPALSGGELRQVVRRRAADFAGRAGEGACSARLTLRTPRATALWLASVERAVSEREREEWLGRGIALARLQSRHLALGQLVRCLPELADGEVVAIFDIESDTGTCVLADRCGWLFSREVPLRFMGRATSVPMASAAPPDDPSLRVFDDAAPASASESAAPAPAEDEQDPLADIAVQAELVATELRRTFRYVEGRIGLQPVARVWLTGEITEWIDLCAALAEQLGIPVASLSEAPQAGRDPQPVGGAAVALGMACAPSASEGNLLAAPAQAARSSRRLRRRLQRALAVASVCLVAGAAAAALQVGSASIRLGALDAIWAADAGARARLEATRALAQRVRALESALAAIGDAQPPATALLRTLAAHVPETAALQRLRLEPSPEGGYALELTVEAAGASVAGAAQSISDLAREVAQAPFVSVEEVEPETTDATQPEADGALRVRFRLAGRLAAVRPAAAPGGAR